MKESWENGIIVKNNYSSNSSNLEKELFKILKNINPEFEENITLKINNKWFFPDIIDKKRKIIIEFFGDFWHCNPLIYKENDDFQYGLKVKDVWEHDKKRLQYFLNKGYKLFIVWEYDYKNNIDNILEKVKSLLV